MSLDNQVTGMIKTLLGSSLFGILLIVTIGAYIFQIYDTMSENVKPEIYHYAGRCVTEQGNERHAGNIGVVFLKTTVTEQFEELEKQINKEIDCQYPKVSKLFIQNIKELKLGN